MELAAKQVKRGADNFLQSLFRGQPEVKSAGQLFKRVSSAPINQELEKEAAFNRSENLRELFHVPTLEKVDYSDRKLWNIHSDAKHAGFEGLVKEATVGVATTVHNSIEKLQAWGEGRLPDDEKVGAAFDAL